MHYICRPRRIYLYLMEVNLVDRSTDLSLSSSSSHEYVPYLFNVTEETSTWSTTQH